MELLKLVITGTVGAFGFSVLFGTKPTHTPFAAFGGMLSTLVYALLDILGVNLFVSHFVAAVVCVIYSNILARVLKTPSMVFITSSIIVLVPGGSLFYTMSNIILGNSQAASAYALSTLQVALGIAGGIVIESLIVSLMSKFSHSRKH